jgi:hypothetical protein
MRCLMLLLRIPQHHWCCVSEFTILVIYSLDTILSPVQLFKIGIYLQTYEKILER